MKILISSARLRAVVCVLFLLSIVPVWARGQVFSVTASPAALTIHPGDQRVPITVSVSSSSYDGPVYVTLTNLPPGISATPITVTPGSSGTLYLNATLAADQEAFPANLPDNPTSATSTILIAGVAGSVQVTTAVDLTTSITNPSFAPAASAINLPIVSIDTGGVAVTSKTVTVPGTVTITSADKQKTYLPSSTGSDNTANFHVHGNTTAGMPKQPYEMKLNTSVDLLSAMGMACPYVTGSGKAICDKSKTYILLANFDDKTMLRDWAASALANAIPMGGDYLTSPGGSPTPSGTATLMPWAPHSLFVELYINGAYEGTYQLIEKVNVDSHRIDITELDDTDTSGDLSGGYQMEIDQEKGEDYNFVTPQGVDIGMNDPDFSPEVPEQEDYITQYVDTAENALFSAAFTDPTKGWRAYFDEASAVNFYIVNDLMGNDDGGRFYSSDYFYKAIDNPLLYMGPVWDFDLSAGNANFTAITSPAVDWTRDATWYQQLFADPAFKADAAKQWNALVQNGIITNWLESVEMQAGALEQTVQNNFGRWPMLGIRVWPNSLVVGSYDGEVDFMIDWIKFRMGYIDSFLNSKQATTAGLTLPSSTLRSGTAVTLTAQVTGGSSPSGTVMFFANNSKDYYGELGTAAVGSGGQASASLALPSGTVSIEAIYSGDTTNAMSVSPSTKVTILAPLAATATALSASGAGTATAVVTAFSGSGTPTGNVTLTANGASVGSASLNAAGVAQLTLPANLADGTALQAAYSGDTTYAASSSNTLASGTASTPAFSVAAGNYPGAQTVSISASTTGASIYYTTDGSAPTIASALYTGPLQVAAATELQAIAVAPGYAASAVAAAVYTIGLAPDFTMTAASDTVTLQAGAASFQLSITGNQAFGLPVTLSCSGLPTGSTCSFSPSSVTPGTAPVTVSGSVKIASASASVSTRWLGRLGSGAVLALLLWPGARRRRWSPSVLLALAAAVTAVSLGGCSSSSSPSTAPTQTYTATVTAAGAFASHSVTLTFK